MMIHQVINAYKFGSVANTGPDFANVVLLLGFDGTNGATTTTDESSFARPLTSFTGNAQLSTAQKKFGTASLLCDGSGDSVQWPFYTLDKDNTSGGIATTDDFQVEAWIRFASGANLSAQHSIITHYDATGNKRSFVMWYNGITGTFEFLYSAAGTSPVSTALSVTWSPSVSTWYHLAYSRVGGISRNFVDGVKLGESAVNNFTCFSTNSAFRVGGIENGGSIAASFNGNIDEVRCAVYEGGGGSGKLYTADFTPPTAAFPRS